MLYSSTTKDAFLLDKLNTFYAHFEINAYFNLPLNTIIPFKQVSKLNSLGISHTRTDGL